MRCCYLVFQVSGSEAAELPSNAIFRQIAAKVQETPEAAKQVSGVFVWKINVDGEEKGDFILARLCKRLKEEGTCLFVH